jgi:enamine deaminase RidA (YjgF/YER057c/UK114 family)
MNVYDRLKELGIALPTAPKPAGLYIPCQLRGNVLYTSGQDCKVNGKLAYEGKLGKDLSIEEGYKAARLTMFNCLAVIEQEIGDLNRVKKIIKLLGFINSTDNFFEQPSVINGASRVLIDVFGEAGKHARMALSANSLPFNIPLEIEMIVEIE